MSDYDFKEYNTVNYKFVNYFDNDLAVPWILETGFWNMSGGWDNEGLWVF